MPHYDEHFPPEAPAGPSLPAEGSLWAFYGTVWRVFQSDPRHIYLEDVRRPGSDNRARIHPSRWPGPYEDAEHPATGSVWELVPDPVRRSVKFRATVRSVDDEYVRLARADGKKVLVPRADWPGSFVPEQKPTDAQQQTRRAMLVGGLAGAPLEELREAAWEIEVEITHQIPQFNKSGGRWKFPSDVDLVVVLQDQAGMKLVGEALAKAGRTPFVYVDAPSFQSDLWRGLQNHWPGEYHTVFGSASGVFGAIPGAYAFGADAPGDVPDDQKVPVPILLPPVWVLDEGTWVMSADDGGPEFEDDSSSAPSGDLLAGALLALLAAAAIGGSSSRKKVS